MEKPILIFHPDIKEHKTNNEYTQKMYEILSEKYTIKSFEWFIKHPFNRKEKYIYLNWYENPVGRELVFIQKMQYFLKYTIMRFAKVRGIKIVYVIHNKSPHNISLSSNLFLKAIKPFMIKALSISDYLIGMCNFTEEFLRSEYGVKNLEEKLVIVPHGKYTKYSCNRKEIRDKYGVEEEEFVCCFVGKMDKYKNVDIMIEAFYRSGIKAKLLLVGKCDTYYKNKILSLIQDNRVICDFSFVTDENMSAIMQSVDAIVLPYDNTSLNSGILINAFTNGTTVIGTDIGMLKDFPQELVYMYSHNDSNHVFKLQEAYQRAYKDFVSSKFRGKGEKLEKIINDNNNWDLVRKNVLSLFD